ncbi:MAG: hypothetical protein ACT4QD_04920 [Acidobacteriota bacterium]
MIPTIARIPRSVGSIGVLTLLAACGLAACKDKASTPTSPTTPTTPATVVAEPSITEEFTGTVPVGGFAFYSFSVGQFGTVNLNYSRASGAGVPGTVWLGMGLGTPSGEDCATTTNVNVPPGTAPQLTGNYNPGVYCVRVFDIGNLFAAANFTVVISHP